MKPTNLKAEYISVTLLKFHPDNPRIIKDTQFEILKDSIKDNPEYFETRPILCNKAMVVFAGNMRLRAAIDIGLKEVPVIIMDVTLEKERELMIRDNVQNGEWQIDALLNTFEPSELKDLGMGPDILGIFPNEENPLRAKSDLIACDRCRELKDTVLGHQRRSGHLIDFSETQE